MTPDLIGRDMRISLADFAGNFVELEPWQRDLADQLAAIPEGEKFFIVSTHDGRDDPIVNFGVSGSTYAASGQRGDRLIIDDPWASEWPALKDEEMRRIDMREKISARDFERDQAGPVNRKARRAAEAKARRAR